MPPKPDSSHVRCAIYMRKSTTQILDSDFNTLDAQREAGEAFIASQKHEGWVCLPERYDDGGYSGATADRPALQRLLREVKAGQVDCVVTYKIDRLSRSLRQFMDIMDVLEANDTSFASVTQAFNTNTAMGEMTLNILLVFAQFERKTIVERVKHKMSAARRRGKWTGGKPPLGYDLLPTEPRLVVNEDEAARVRAIFALYREEQSLMPTVKELKRRGWYNKLYVTKKGREIGGRPFDRVSLHRLLTSALSLGKVDYEGKVYEGEHEAIVDGELWREVQRLLQANACHGGSRVRNKHGALLKGLLRCQPCDAGMLFTYTSKGPRLYKYYVCQRAHKEGWSVCPTKSLPAGEIESFVVARIRSIGADPELVAETVKQATEGNRKQSKALADELASLRRDLKRQNAKVKKLAAQAGGGGSKNIAQIKEHHEHIASMERRAREVRAELAALANGGLDADQLAAALERFDPVWDALTRKEQARILQLLVSRMDYDGGASTVTISFRPSGVRALAAEAEAASVI